MTHFTILDVNKGFVPDDVFQKSLNLKTQHTFMVFSKIKSFFLKRPSQETALPVHTLIQDYTIARIHHRGGFSWVYKAWGPDARPVLIKEYYPHSMSRRKSNGSVAPTENNEEAFLEGARRFHEEARILSMMRGTGVPKIQSFIRENQTFYMIFAWERGRTLSQYLRVHQSPIPENVIRSYLSDFLKTLQKIHNENILHMDIHPANLFLRLNGRPMILDYGSSRHVGDSFLFSGAFRMYTHGFTPPELIQKNGKIGAWSDIYSLGACLRACRLNDHVEQYSEELINLMNKCTQHAPEKRPQSLKDPVFNSFMDVGSMV
jgi:hypothetical protein